MCMATLNRNPKLLAHSIKRSRRISTPASRIASWMVYNIGVVHSVHLCAKYGTAVADSDEASRNDR